MVEREIQDVFSPMIGQLAWSVRRGVGSFLTLEFGFPHLIIRDPIKASLEASEEVKRSLARRRVFVFGEHHLWIQHANWEINTENYFVDSDTVDTGSTEDCLGELSGQILTSIGFGACAHSRVFIFDLGGCLTTSPMPESGGDDQWSIHEHSGMIISFKKNGIFMLDHETEDS